MLKHDIFKERMISFFKAVCSHCNTQISIFEKAWQDQRTSPKKICPKCSKNVKITLNGKIYAIWFLSVASISFMLFYLGFPKGGAVLIPLSFIFPVPLSFQLEKDVP
jgi:hypothetical protein